MTVARDQYVAKFYDGLACDYEVVYGGAWERAVGQQGDALDRLIRASIPDARSALDCACGIGTQAMGLAGRGYRVVGRDLSGGAIDRASVLTLGEHNDAHRVRAYERSLGRNSTKPRAPRASATFVGTVSRWWWAINR